MQQESTKKEYGQHVHDGVFTLILSTTGGMGRKATPFYKSLADGISKSGFASLVPRPPRPAFVACSTKSA